MNSGVLGAILFYGIMISCGIVYVVIIISRTKKMPDKIKNLAKMYPAVFDDIGIEKTPMANMFSPILLERAVWKRLPKELRNSEPMMMVPPNLLMHVNKASDISAIYAEGYTVEYSIINGIKVMSDKLGVYCNKSIQNLLDTMLCKYKKVAERDNRYLVACSAGLGLIPSKSSTFTKQLKVLCAALRISYNDVSLGKYEGTKSSFVGIGSWGAMGVGAALSIGSAVSNSNKKAAMDVASVYIAYYSIAEIFNQKFFPTEYSVWLENGEEKKQLNQNPN